MATCMCAILHTIKDGQLICAYLYDHGGAPIPHSPLSVEWGTLTSGMLYA